MSDFDKRALPWKLSDFEVPSFCGKLHLQLGYVTVSFWVYHKTYTSKSLHYSTLYGISITCFFFSHFAFSLCFAYTIFLHYCYFYYLFLAIALLNNLNFVYIDIKITYLHLELTKIQCILGCTPCVDALQWVWVD